MAEDITFRAGPGKPCPCCGATSKSCSATVSELVLCRGEPHAGWRCVGGPDRAGFHQYRGQQHGGNGNGKRRATNRTARPTDWAAESRRHAGRLDAKPRHALAAALGLPVEAIDLILGLGWFPDERWGACWTIPEVSPSGQVVGIGRRYVEPIPTGQFQGKNKLALGNRGLILPVGWRDRPGPTLLVEGFSDTLAAAQCGLSAVGRPSNTGGVEMLAEALADREVLVVGENDARPHKTEPGKTDWPGRDGAEQTAQALADVWGRPVRWSMPPAGYKDLRQWVNDLASGAGDGIDWPGFGRTVTAALLAAARLANPTGLPLAGGQVERDVGELQVEALDGIRPKPIRYLVKDRVPAGMMGLFAGEGGEGKTITMMELCSAVTVGRCAFGLDYPDPVRGRVLLISCEDDWESTVVPRLAALGADLSKILRVQGVRMKADGQTLDFHLGHFRELKRLLMTHPDIRLVVIDPAGAYIGRAGVNENRDAELRTILGPLSEAANASGATILLVKHLNKSAGVSAVQRVSGSAGYVNACRFAYMVARDPDEPARKLVLPIKSNVLPAGLSGLAYRLVPVPFDEARGLLTARWPNLAPTDLDGLAAQLFRQQWEDGVTADPNEVSARKRGKDRPDEVGRCVAFIREFLGGHTWPDAELEAAVHKAGFSMRAFKGAKADLRTPDKTDPTRLSSRPRGEGGPWWVWIGPQAQPCPDRLLHHTEQTHHTDESDDSDHSGLPL